MKYNKNTVKLHEIPKDSKIRLPIMREGAEESVMEVCDFKHIDGMYSLIITPAGEPVHLYFMAQVEKGEDGVYTLTA